MTEKKYTIRIYDKRIEDRLQRIYNDLPVTFKTMNELMKELIDRGLRSLEKDIYNKKDETDLSSLFDEIRHTSDNLHLLTNIVQEKFKELSISNKVLQKLAGCNYSLLSGINSGQPKDHEYVEKGFYDKLPERFVSIIEDLLKNYK